STVEREARGAARPGGGYRIPARKGRGGNFELYSWFFMRISGLVLIFMALYHLVWWNLVVGVEHLSADLVRERWTNPFWRLFNVGLATFAMLHGLNGLRYSIEDYVRRPGLRVAVKAVAYTVILAALAWAVFALLTFDPAIPREAGA
ncbi:MAG TPA: succinate dehydrogenase, partial [Chloroflexota bacterium]|nr:succinate dehydrogenase [Chloroflexota bacterium]